MYQLTYVARRTKGMKSLSRAFVLFVNKRFGKENTYTRARRTYIYIYFFQSALDVTRLRQRFTHDVFFSRLLYLRFGFPTLLYNWPRAGALVWPLALTRGRSYQRREKQINRRDCSRVLRPFSWIFFGDLRDDFFLKRTRDQVRRIVWRFSLFSVLRTFVD